MDVRQLTCFDAVLRTGSMTRAAELLELAQPTVSVTISQLEREIGFLLFKRSKGALEPTPEAYSFHQAASQAIDSVTRVSQVALDIRQLNLGHIAVLCYPGIAWRLLPELIARFRDEHPGVRTKLVSRSSEALRQLALAQNFDTAIVEAPVRLPRGRAETFTYRCLCAVSHEHPLSNKKFIRPTDLDGEPLAILFPEHVTHHQIRKAFAGFGAELNVALECDFFASAYSFVRANGGVAIIDPITASQIEPGKLKMIPFEPKIDYQLVLLRPTNRATSRLSEAFFLQLRTKLKELQ